MFVYLPKLLPPWHSPAVLAPERHWIGIGCSQFLHGIQPCGACQSAARSFGTTSFMHPWPKSWKMICLFFFVCDKLPETNSSSSSLKRWYPKRKGRKAIVFQASIFRCKLAGFVSGRATDVKKGTNVGSRDQQLILFSHLIWVGAWPSQPTSPQPKRTYEKLSKSIRHLPGRVTPVPTRETVGHFRYILI